MSIMINYKSRSYVLELIQFETIDEAYIRLWKIIQHQPLNDVEYNHWVNVSKLWYYKHKYECTYSENCEHILMEF